MNVTNQDLIDKLKAGREISFKFSFNSPEINQKAAGLVIYALSHVQQNFLRTVVTSILVEITSNAVKANLKRIYLKQNNADPENPEQYKKLMQRFNEVVIQNTNTYRKALEESGLEVELNLQILEQGIKILITNNTAILPQELQRIQERMRKAADYNSLSEAFKETDGMEGAGLGLIMNLLLLKKSGIGAESFKILSKGDSTQAQLIVPRRLNLIENVQEVKNRVIETIKGIPTFPAAINKILQLCDHPDSGMKEVSKAVEQDPALTVDMLRLVNSAGLNTAKSIETIQQAVGILGLKAIRSMAMASAARKILKSHFKTYKGFWEHSFKCAFYSRKIAETCGFKAYAENVYLSGLLHDLGKIVLYSINPDNALKIAEMSIDMRERGSSTLEEISLGVSHTEIGAQVARHWNFNAHLHDVILYHHCPGAADEHSREEASIVHVADGIVTVEENRGKFQYINGDASALLGLHTQEDYEKLHGELQASYHRFQTEQGL